MANVLGAFRHLGPDGLPIRVLDGLQATGQFRHLGEDGLPLDFLLTESHEVLGATTCALQMSGVMSLSAPEPVNLPLTFSLRGQVAPHAAPVSFALQTAGLMTHAFASGHLAFTLKQEVPALLTPVAAHAESLPLTLGVAGDPGSQAHVMLALATAAGAAAHGQTSLALGLAGVLAPAASITGSTSLALATAGELAVGPQGHLALVLLTAGELQQATLRAEVALALQVAGVLAQGVRGATTLALATAGAIPQDATAALVFVLATAGSLEPANHNVTGGVGLALALFGGATLGANPVYARLREFVTLHPSRAGIPGGTSYE